MNSKTFLVAGTESSQRDLHFCIKVCILQLCLKTAAFSVLANDSPFTTTPRKNVNREICDIFNGFYCIIAFSSASQSRCSIFETLPFYLRGCLHSEVLMCYPYRKRACLAARSQINSSSAQLWFVKAIYVFGGSLFLLLNKPKCTTVSLRVK